VHSTSRARTERRRSGAGRTFDALDARRSVDARCVISSLSAGRTGDGGSAVDAVDDAGRGIGHAVSARRTVDAGRCISSTGHAVSPGRSVGALSAGCALDADDAGRSFGRGLLACQAS